MLKHVPNALTVVRFLLIPFILFYIFTGNYILAFIFFNIWGLFSAPLAVISKDYSNLVKAFLTAVFWLSGIIWNPATIKNTDANISSAHICTLLIISLSLRIFRKILHGLCRRNWYGSMTHCLGRSFALSLVYEQNDHIPESLPYFPVLCTPAHRIALPHSLIFAF